MKLKDILLAGGISIFGLGLAGCGYKDEIIYSGKTSQGDTQVISETCPILMDNRKVIIGRGDTTWTIYNFGNNEGVGNDSLLNQSFRYEDYAIVKTLIGEQEFRTKKYIEGGRTYEGENFPGCALVAKSRELLQRKFNEMYQKAIEEAKDSLMSKM